MSRLGVFLIVVVMCLSLPCAAGMVVGNFEGGSLEGWGLLYGTPPGNVILTAVDGSGAETTGNGAMKIDMANGGWGGKACVPLLSNKPAMALLTGPGARVAMDVSVRSNDVGGWGQVCIGINCNGNSYWNPQGNFQDVSIGSGDVFSTATYVFTITEAAKTALLASTQYAEVFIMWNGTNGDKIYVDNIRIVEDESVPFNPSPVNDLSVVVDTHPVLSWNTALNPATGKPFLNIRKHGLIGSFNNASPADPNIYYIGEVNAPTVSGSDPNIAATAQYPATGTMSLASDRVYYWKIVELVDNGHGGVYPVADPNNIAGLVWKFKTKPAYIAPSLNVENVITTLALANPGPISISAAVVNNSNTITSATVTLLTDAGNIASPPTGAHYTFVDTTSDKKNPTATLVTDTAGTYFVKVVVGDGTTTVEAVAEVVVYADACQAKKDSPSGWAANYYDRDGDCDVDIADFAVLAAVWLNDTSMHAQEEYAGPADYVPQSVWNARIEAESANRSSNPPLDADGPGIRIGADVNRSGGYHLAYAYGGEWVEYDIALAAGTYDVWVSSASDGMAPMSFGNAADADLYGSVTTSGTGWNDYKAEQFVGALNLPAVTTIRITWESGGNNTDWFTLVKQQ